MPHTVFPVPKWKRITARSISREPRNPIASSLSAWASLGGGELNFSSDVDVIFLYEDDEGESSGGSKGKVGPREFFSAIGRKIIHAMGDITEDGFVFRIDLRLRPLGANGPLVQSVDSAMLYYESWGQCWERAAMIKARPVAGAIELGSEFLKGLEPFIYRRYLDYTTVDELRHMKERIENELLTGDDKARNLKLGYGGIREVEFFTQALQLVNGGYEPSLRGPSTLPALAELAKLKFISIEERDKLTEAYRFLRQAEHKVQIVQEGHVHSIPEGKDEEQAYARRYGLHSAKASSANGSCSGAITAATPTACATFSIGSFIARRRISRTKAPAPRGRSGTTSTIRRSSPSNWPASALPIR